MSIKLSLLFLSFLSFVIILLSNLNMVNIQIFGFSFEVPLAMIISFSVVLGLVVSSDFLYLYRHEKKLIQKIRTYRKKATSTNKY